MTLFSANWQKGLIGVAAAMALSACGGGTKTEVDSCKASGTFSSVIAPTFLASQNDSGAPVLSGVVATDGLNWFNFRRKQAGLSVLSRSSLIDKAAQNHSDYQNNNGVTHDEEAGKSGYTGTTLQERLSAAGYPATGTLNVWGEVISGTSTNTGFYMAEELVTAIYHRFVIFEPVFKEIGAGSATKNGYIIFTSNFGAANGYGPGVGTGKLVSWPYTGQTNVPTNFFSDYESPDPVPCKNEVGYPISVHADIKTTVAVQSFSVREHGSSTDLAVQLLKNSDTDPHTPVSAAAIIPTDVLKSGTTYDVSFVGTVGSTPVTRSWSFTTK
ncbi:MAG: CAP domain-containing protein [Massilia sp.]